MKVALTGASGLLGSRVRQRLLDEGHTCIALGRPAFRLGDGIDTALFHGADVLVHCAYDFTAVKPADVERINVDGSIRLFESARQAGVRRTVFVSSMAAFDGCRSAYGRGKLQLEAWLGGRDAVSVRPGLLYTDALDRGLVGALGKIAGLPIVPMIGRGNFPFYMAHVDDVAALLVSVAVGEAGAKALLIRAAHPEVWPLRRLIGELRRRRGMKPAPALPVPAAAVLAALKALESIGLRPPFRSDSLVSMMNPDPAPTFPLGERFRPF